MVSKNGRNQLVVELMPMPCASWQTVELCKQLSLEGIRYTEFPTRPLQVNVFAGKHLVFEKIQWEKLAMEISRKTSKTQCVFFQLIGSLFYSIYYIHSTNIYWHFLCIGYCFRL